MSLCVFNDRTKSLRQAVPVGPRRAHGSVIWVVMDLRGADVAQRASGISDWAHMYNGPNNG